MILAQIFRVISGTGLESKSSTLHDIDLGQKVNKKETRIIDLNSNWKVALHSFQTPINILKGEVVTIVRSIYNLMPLLYTRSTPFRMKNVEKERRGFW